MGHVADQHQGADHRIARDELREDLRMESGEDTRQDLARRLHRVGPEEDPAQANEMEGDDHPKHAPRGRHLRSRLPEAWPTAHHKLMDRQRNPMQGAPQDETDRRPVPQSAQEHRDHQVRVGTETALSVAAQRDVEIILQPRGERDVPPAPKLGNRGRLVGRVEVDVEPEAQEERQPDGHVGIAREVAIDLQGVAIDAHQVLEAGIERRRVEHTVNEIETDIVRDHRLLHQATEDEEKSLAKRLAGHQRIAVDLRDEIACPHDRSRHQLGEKGDVEEVIDPSAERLDPPPVDVDHVADALEGEERDADGQEDVPRLELEVEQPPGAEIEAQVVEHQRQRSQQEVEILEVGQHAEVHAEAQRHQSLAGTNRGGLGQVMPDEEIGSGREDQQAKPEAAALVIEIKGEERHVDDPRHHLFPQKVIEHRETDKEEEEKPAAEQHRRVGLIGQQVGQPPPRKLVIHDPQHAILKTQSHPIQHLYLDYNYI